MTWKDLYAQAMTRQGAMRDVLRRSVAAVQGSGRPELARRINSERTVPLYVLCASLDVYGIEVPAEASAFIDGPSLG
jgi:hypothetical protein